ncbi:CDK2-associated and cullin domain-containing protein 1 isoform X2 [Chanos chanos]|uniref:CDK2-associated and cullin domain-containing protein 1 isoform X2 n=1 Tax=Chanos chanos TaxID=29144 RepID=A0A6J2V7X3_CHACN|nr:CDK2-associated and cullin domain-containing protein 1 isoform X2 [Chanos chanos]
MDEDRLEECDNTNSFEKFGNACSNARHLQSDLPHSHCPPLVGPSGIDDNAHLHSDSCSRGEQMCMDANGVLCTVSSDSCSSKGTPDTGRLILHSSSKILMNAMTADDYKRTYWPKLERAIEHLLTRSPMDHISISYEQIYSHVYKCVCQQHSDLLYSDLIWKITCHLKQVSTELQGSPSESFIENFNLALTQYTAALQCIVPVFIYMNKFYVETKLHRDMQVDLMKLFSDHVAEKHLNTLIPLLQKAHYMPFQVKPSTMASVVKGLYALKPDWALLAPALFSRFIPQIHPPAQESQLPDYAAQDQELQMALTQTGFSRKKNP